MFRRLSKTIKMILAVVVGVSILAGCSASGPGQQAVSGGYPLISVSKNGNQESYIYQADKQSVPEVAKKLSSQKKPDQISKNSVQQMFLVYPNELYDIQRDKKNPANTLIEVSNKEFVRNNYSSSFLRGFLSGVLLDHLFQLGSGSLGSYRGYTGGRTVPSSAKYQPPTASEKKTIPPITKQTTGSIIKRSRSGNSPNTLSSTFSKIKNSVTNDVGQAIRSAENSTGKIFKSNTGQGSNNVFPKNSRISVPKNNSPPKISTKGFGRIMKRSR
ncbi:DUF4247 domain-containing protein [Sporolactobacillus pectinivorans]|uniref:DUF4247 domain-containing protein n=1 Tax=Sporolactobacillus pectinivorans TaxID=1591408 RepID=UPI0012FD0B5F|nr:DUF4247 domain-containing protein [Sporolactobacillus pectinivorans]